MLIVTAGTSPSESCDRSLMWYMKFQAFTPNKCSKILSGVQPRQSWVNSQSFEDLLCLHHQGRHGKRPKVTDDSVCQSVFMFPHIEPDDGDSRFSRRLYLTQVWCGWSPERKFIKVMAYCLEGCGLNTGSDVGICVQSSSHWCPTSFLFSGCWIRFPTRAKAAGAWK
jgi:hypothetical protein